MACYVRMMFKEDVEQVTEIDREAFPTQWPPANYKHELRNRLAHYIVVCDDNRLLERTGVIALQENVLSKLMSRIKRFFIGGSSSSDEQLNGSGHFIAGFVGFWIMADEAHITSIAVREKYRRQGLGELLLASAIDMAYNFHARIVTLEARVSNTGAHQLYEKYGFNKVGMRKGYYTDNREDAVVMSTTNINSASYRNQLKELKKELSAKLGIQLKKLQQ